MGDRLAFFVLALLFGSTYYHADCSIVPTTRKQTLLTEGATFPANRRLIWHEFSEEVCDDEQLTVALAIDSTYQTCIYGAIQWDPSNTLFISYIVTSGASDPNLQFYARYSGNSNELCFGITTCTKQVPNEIYTEEYVILDDYGYDCSNIYCGPNAIRDCATGLSSSVPCTGNLVSSPEIPSHELVQCTKVRQSYPEGTDCSECALGDEGEIYFECNLQCQGCLTDGNCATNPAVRHAFQGRIIARRDCRTWSVSGAEECTARFVGGIVIDDPQWYYESASCAHTWNGEACICEVCGYDDQSTPLISTDCSDAVGVAETGYNECTGTYTGAFAIVMEGFDATATCSQGIGQEGDPAVPASSPISVSIPAAGDPAVPASSPISLPVPAGGDPAVPASSPISVSFPIGGATTQPLADSGPSSPLQGGTQASPGAPGSPGSGQIGTPQTSACLSIYFISESQFLALGWATLLLIAI